MKGEIADFDWSQITTFAHNWFKVNIGHNWLLTVQQKSLLKKYYFANQLLTQCLHQDCYVSPEVRQQIEDQLNLVTGDRFYILTNINYKTNNSIQGKNNF